MPVWRVVRGKERGNTPFVEVLNFRTHLVLKRNPEDFRKQPELTQIESRGGSATVKSNHRQPGNIHCPCCLVI